MLVLRNKNKDRIYNAKFNVKKYSIVGINAKDCANLIVQTCMKAIKKKVMFLIVNKEFSKNLFVVVKQK